MKPRWRGFSNSVTEGSITELLNGEGSGAERVAQNFSGDRPQSRLFDSLSRELLSSGNGIRFQAHGSQHVSCDSKWRNGACAIRGAG